MKLLFSNILILTILFFNTSCHREFSFEKTIAKGYLQKTPMGDCSPVSVTGTYQTDSLLKGATNYVEVLVNISETGSYFITTDTLNSYYFSAAGSFAVKGLNTVRLLASGRPMTASLNIFTVKYDTSSCQFNNVVTGMGGGATNAPANFIFNCALSKATGFYLQGMPTTAANIITLPVTVTNGGSYSITTTNNGVIFSGSGILPASPSAQTITLYATLNNVPIASGQFSYTCIGGGGPACSVNITYSAAPMSTTDSIVATIDSVDFSFKINDTAKLDNTSITGYAGIHIKGTNNATGNETFLMNIARNGTSIAAGTYTVNNFPASINSTVYSTASANYSRTTNLTPGMLQNFGFNIIITAVTRTKVTGTFSGRLLDKGMGPLYKTVTNGIFSVTIYP